MKKKKGNFTTLLLILVLLAGLSLLLYPSVSDYWNSFHQTRAIATYAEEVANLNQDQYDEIWAATKAYNASLAERDNAYLLSDAQKELALEFIKYMTSEEIANKIIAFGIGMAPNTNVDYTTLMDSVDAPEAKLLVSACQLCMAADYQALGLGNEFGDFEGEIQSKYAGLKDGSKTVDDVVKDLDAVIAAN